MDEVSSCIGLNLPSLDGKSDHKFVHLVFESASWKGLGAESEEKHEPASDIEHLLNRPIREADFASK